MSLQLASSALPPPCKFQIKQRLHAAFTSQIHKLSFTCQNNLDTKYKNAKLNIQMKYCSCRNIEGGSGCPNNKFTGTGQAVKQYGCFQIENSTMHILKHYFEQLQFHQTIVHFRLYHCFHLSLLRGK